MYPCACLRGDKWPSSGWVAGDDKVGLLYGQLRGQSREDLLSPRALDELVALAGVHRSETSWRGQCNAGPGWGQIWNLEFSGDVSQLGQPSFWKEVWGCHCYLCCLGGLQIPIMSEVIGTEQLKEYLWWLWLQIPEVQIITWVCPVIHSSVFTPQWAHWMLCASCWALMIMSIW